MGKDLQRNKWFLTQNNPLNYGLDHKSIKEVLITNFPTISFIAMADEQGSCFHTHAFIYFSSRVRFSKLKKYFPHARFDAVKGTSSECISYLKKDGKWIDDKEKSDTKIAGSYEEWGEKPPDKGSKKEMDMLLQMVKEGYSDLEIVSENPDLIPLLSTIQRLRTTVLIEKFRGQRRLELRCIYVSGATGSGKTRGVLDTHGDDNVYKINDYHHPFDSYNCEEVMLFDEFRSQIRLSDMLQYIDIYPVHLPARYAQKYMCSTIIYIVSNWELEKQYHEIQKDNKESWNAFLRRITEVRTHAHDGTITVYNSVEEYMNRNSYFRPPTKEEEEDIGDWNDKQ